MRQAQTHARQHVFWDYIQISQRDQLEKLLRELEEQTFGDDVVAAAAEREAAIREMRGTEPLLGGILKNREP